LDLKAIHLEKYMDMFLDLGYSGIRSLDVLEYAEDIGQLFSNFVDAKHLPHFRLRLIAYFESRKKEKEKEKKTRYRKSK